jgi:hypothetical protein
MNNSNELKSQNLLQKTYQFTNDKSYVKPPFDQSKSINEKDSFHAQKIEFID